jgi:hypothetical protein
MTADIDDNTVRALEQQVDQLIERLALADTEAVLASYEAQVDGLLAAIDLLLDPVTLH